MKITTTNSTTVISRWTRFLGVPLCAGLMVAFMVPAVTFSQAAPNLNLPVNNATLVPTTATFSWFAATGDSVYHLQISKSNVFAADTVYNDSTLTGVSHIITGLVNGTLYYWRVSVKDGYLTNGGGTSPYSETRSFTTYNPTPVTPLLPVTLGLTGGFAILSYAGISNTSVTTSITGDIGVNPAAGTLITGLLASNVVGTIYTTNDAGPAGHVWFPSMLVQAMLDLTTAYNDAAGRTVNPIGVSGNLGGRTLYSGLYKSTGSLEITSGDLTLDAQGDPTAVWIFQIQFSFNMTSYRQVFLTNGAKASNIFWQVGSGATFGTYSVMRGTIMAYSNITFATGATLEGRALARTESVTLDAGAIGGTINSPIHRVVFLGTAANFRILARDSINSTGTVVVTGDIGVSPSTTIHGFPPATLIGVPYPGDATSAAARVDLIAAYDSTSARTVTATIATELGGTTRTAGVYNSNNGNFAITSDTLKLSGTASDVFIFKMTGTLTTAVGSRVTLTGGAVWPNVFWQVGSSASIDGDFKGTILALTNITQNTDTVYGRLLARNGFVTVNGNAVLPVELVAFTATANRMNADLRWSTATEVNNYGFEIERRQTAQRVELSTQWAKVGFVSGAGTSNAPRDYSYTDNNLSPGRYAYRLKQVDNNGAFSYHVSAEVEIGLAPQKFELSQNYPNPFNPSTKIQYSLEKASQVSLKVYNVLGLEVATLVNGRQEAGSYTVPFGINKETLGLSSGVYFYRLEAGSFVSTKKLMLMK